MTFLLIFRVTSVTSESFGGMPTPGYRPWLSHAFPVSNSDYGGGCKVLKGLEVFFCLRGVFYPEKAAYSHAVHRLGFLGFF